MFKIKGKIQFDPIDVTKKHKSQSSWKKTVIVKFGCDLSNYYAWFLKRRFGVELNPPLRGAHFTIINDRIDDLVYNEAKKIFNNTDIEIIYDPTIVKTDAKGHWWIKAHSQDAQNMRNVLGLDKPYHGFHITLGLATHLWLDHSLYIREQCRRFKLLEI